MGFPTWKNDQKVRAPRPQGAQRSVIHRPVGVRLTIVDNRPARLGRAAMILGMLTAAGLVFAMTMTVIFAPRLYDVGILNLQMPCSPITMNMTETEGDSMPDHASNNALPPLIYGEPEVKNCLDQLTPGEICYTQKVTFQVRKEVIDSVLTNKTRHFNKNWYRVEMTRHYNYRCAPWINVSQKTIYSTVLYRSRTCTNIYSDYDMGTDSFLMKLRIDLMELAVPGMRHFCQY